MPDFLEEARFVGDKLARGAVWHRDRCTWLTRPVTSGDGAPPPIPTLHPLGANVYAGTAGVGLFLARLHRHTGDRAHGRAAAGALRQAVHLLLAPPTPDRLHVRFGYYAGDLGVAWACHEGATLLDDPALARHAERILRTLAPPGTLAHHHDLVSGSAGAIPTLLAMGGRHAETAKALGEGLLASAQRDASGWSWYFEPPPGMTFHRNLVGFSHGTAGVAWALAELYRATGDERFREGAERAFDHERSAFDPETGTWPDYRAAPDARGRHPAQDRWCHGAPGIGLARAMAYPILKDPRLLAEARVALALAAKTLERHLATPGEDATLCCGTGGILESYWRTADVLGAPRVLDTVRGAMALQVARAGKAAQARWPTIEWTTPVVNGFNPGLQQGVAGLGNLLLRLHDPSVPAATLPPVPVGR